MNPSLPFILRPIATTLLMVAILLSGLIAYRFLPLAALPEVDYPTIQVQTFYPGARAMSRTLLNIAKRSLPRLMLSGVGLASKEAV